MTIHIQEMSRLIQSGRMPEARALGTRLLERSPANPQVLALLGSVHGRLGEFKEAESCYRMLVALEPGSFQHHCYLGLSLIMQNRLAEAVAPFETMLRLRPDFAEGHMHMGCLRRDLGNHDLAISHLRQALALSPALFDAAVFLANILAHRGMLSEASKLYDQVLMKLPGHPDAVGGKVSVLEKQDRPDAAWECLTAAMAANPVTPNLAIIHAKLAPKHGHADRARSLLNELLSRPNWAPSQIQEMHFALGALEDRKGNYDSAFAHFRSANDLSPHAFDLAAKTRKAHGVAQVFTQTDLPTAEPPPAGTPTPIFIVGMPRSGTSLVEQILACHPDVAAAGELETMSYIEHFACRLAGRPGDYPECLRGASATDMTRLAKPYIEKINTVAGGARFVTDKLPANYERLGLIEKLFPDARIIHTSRHPLDTCLSCYFQNFSNTHTYSSNLRLLGEVYRLYQWQMACWHEILLLRILDVDYESLVSDTERTIRRLLEFCGLGWEPRCLEFHKSTRYVNTASYDQVRQPIYRSSVGRWRHYESHLEELIDALSGPVEEGHL